MRTIWSGSLAVVCLVGLGCGGAVHHTSGANQATSAAAQDVIGEEAAVGATNERKSPTTAPSDVAAPPVDALKTQSGLASKVLRKGTGDYRPQPMDSVTVHYSGWTTDGKLFDSSIVRGEPATFPLNKVIEGWTEGVGLMVVGEKRRLWIPADMAYGDTPSRPGAPAGMLVFDVELIEIQKAAPAEDNQEAFERFRDAVQQGKEKLCACPDKKCAIAVAFEMQQVKEPDTPPTQAQKEIFMPLVKEIQACMRAFDSEGVSNDGKADGKKETVPVTITKAYEKAKALLARYESEMCGCEDRACAEGVLALMQSESGNVEALTQAQSLSLMPKVKNIRACLSEFVPEADTQK